MEDVTFNQVKADREAYKAFPLQVELMFNAKDLSQQGLNILSRQKDNPFYRDIDCIAESIWNKEDTITGNSLNVAKLAGLKYDIAVNDVALFYCYLFRWGGFYIPAEYEALQAARDSINLIKLIEHTEGNVFVCGDMQLGQAKCYYKDKYTIQSQSLIDTLEDEMYKAVYKVAGDINSEYVPGLKNPEDMGNLYTDEELSKASKRLDNVESKYYRHFIDNEYRAGICAAHLAELLHWDNRNILEVDMFSFIYDVLVEFGYFKSAIKLMPGVSDKVKQAKIKDLIKYYSKILNME